MTRLSNHRHAELVWLKPSSTPATIAQTEPVMQSLGWTLKQVQGDNEAKAGVDW